MPWKKLVHVAKTHTGLFAADEVMSATTRALLRPRASSTYALLAYMLAARRDKERARAECQPGPYIRWRRPIMTCAAGAFVSPESVQLAFILSGVWLSKRVLHAVFGLVLPRGMTFIWEEI